MKNSLILAGMMLAFSYGHALEVYELTPLDVGHILLGGPNSKGVYTLNPLGNLMIQGDIHHVGNATPAEFEIDGRPGELVQVQITNTQLSETGAKTIPVTTFTSSLPNWQCTINQTGKCDFFVGLSFPVSKNYQGQINEQSIQVNVNDILLTESI